MSDWPQTFRAAFCAQFECTDEVFIRRVFWKCLRPTALPFAVCPRWFWPGLFEVDFDSLERVGRTRSASELNVELRSYQDNLRLRGGRLKRLLRLRISCARLQKLAEQLFAPAPKVASDP